MPISKQNRTLKRYMCDPSEFSGTDFLGLVDFISTHATMQPSVSTNINLQFEDSQLTGDLSEVRGLLSQVDSEEPYNFQANLTAGTNPRKSVTLTLNFGQQLVTLNVQNSSKADVKPFLDKLESALPKTNAPVTYGPQSRSDQSESEEVYLPGAFRPIPMPDLSERDVFVVMSFAREHRDAFNLAIEPVLTELGFNAIRVDQIQHNTTVTPEIMRQIERAAFVVADLTGERPNVYYEIGYAHRADKEVVLVARSDTAVHFDVSAINRIEYSDYTELMDALRKRVRAIAERLGLATAPNA